MLIRRQCRPPGRKPSHKMRTATWGGWAERERSVPIQLAGLPADPMNQENGAVESKPDRAGPTPLHYAALGNDVRKADALLEGGADPNAADRQGFTPLHFAAQQWSVQAAEILLGRGAAVDAINRHDNTRSSQQCSTQMGVEPSLSCCALAVRTHWGPTRLGTPRRALLG